MDVTYEIMHQKHDFITPWLQIRLEAQIFLWLKMPLAQEEKLFSLICQSLIQAQPWLSRESGEKTLTNFRLLKVILLAIQTRHDKAMCIS